MQQQAKEGSAPRSGAQAVAGAVIAVLGALAAVRPDNPLLKVLSDAVPQVAATLPAVITACGAVIAALSDPPKVGRK